MIPRIKIVTIRIASIASFLCLKKSESINKTMKIFGILFSFYHFVKSDGEVLGVKILGRMTCPAADTP